MSGEPWEAIRSLEGRIWRKVVKKEEVAFYEQSHAVIATRLVAGRTVIHVFSETNPGAGFEPTTGSLEDVYFSTLHQARKEAA